MGSLSAIEESELDDTIEFNEDDIPSLSAIEESELDILPCAILFFYLSLSAIEESELGFTVNSDNFTFSHYRP